MSDAYLKPEDRARLEIDKQLEAAGWVVQSRDEVDVFASPGVALRDRTGMPDPDYLLFVDGKACGTLEAKKDGWTLTGVEGQSDRYAESLPEGAEAWGLPLRFAYEATSHEVRFTDRLDHDARSRRVYAVHRPETQRTWLRDEERDGAPTLRGRLKQMPEEQSAKLWRHQREAIVAIEESLAQDRPRTLLQMATGSGKTFTAANLAYRLVKHARARRVLFLVDRRNLGDQAENEFKQFVTPDEKRKMAELYGIQRLLGGHLRDDTKITISTIQGVYASLTDTEMPDEDEEDEALREGPPVEIGYSQVLPPDAFDIIIVDEAHRSIYGRWRPVLEYFDAHVIGLTATPTKATFGFFEQNLAYEYSHEQAVADGNNVPFDVYRIRTRIGTEGSDVERGAYVKFRDRATREQRLEQLDEDFDYDAAELDRRVVATDQIRTVVRHFKEHLFKPEEQGGIFPGRSVVPKTLIFAKDDSHADDIVDEVRRQFGKGNDFCQKITSKSTGASSDELLSRFRNDFNPRIAVTVDLIATGTDVKAIECVFFMRAVKSRTYFEQMKGRGSRSMDAGEFQSVTNDPVQPTKDRFVIVDAVGVTDVDQQDTVPMERSRSSSIRKLFEKVGVGGADIDELSSIAGRLARLERKLTPVQRDRIEEAAGGKTLSDITGELLAAADPDRREARARRLAIEAHGTEDVTADQVAEQVPAVLREAAKTLRSNPKLRTAILEAHASNAQLIDELSADAVVEAGYAKPQHNVLGSWREYMESHREEIDTLQVLYSDRSPQVEEKLTSIAAEIQAPPYNLSPEAVWEAYEQLDTSHVHGTLRQQVTDLLALIRYELGMDDELRPFAEVVEWRWQQWLQEQDAATRFTPEQREWLELMKNVVTNNVGITAADFDTGELFDRGGLGRAAAEFGGDVRQIIDELNQALLP